MASKDGASGSSASFDLNRDANQVGNVGVGFDEYFGVNLNFSGEKEQGFSFRDVSNSSGNGKNISVGRGGGSVVIGGDVSEVEVPKKRGRGRPRKTETAKTPGSIGKISENSAMESGLGRVGVGSPEGSAMIKRPHAGSGVLRGEEGSSSMKRGRGRPRKSASMKILTSIGSADVVYGDGIEKTDWCVVGNGGVEIDAALDGVFCVGEETSSKKRGIGRPRKSPTSETLDGISRFADKAADYDVTQEFGSSVAGRVVTVADDIVCFTKESYEEGGRGRPLMSASTKTPDGTSRLDDVVYCDATKKIGSSVVGSGVGSAYGETSKKRGRGRPPKSATMKSPDSIGKFSDKVAMYDISNEIASSVVGHIVGAADGVIQVKEDTLKSGTMRTAGGIGGFPENEVCKKRGRGRPPKSATAKTPDSNGGFHEKVAVANSASTTAQDGHGIFDDEVVVTKGINDKIGLGVACNGVNSPDATVQVKEEDTPKKRGRGRPPNSATMEIQDSKGQFDVDVMAKKDETIEIGSIVSVNGVSAVDGSVEVMEEGTSEKRGRGRPPKSAASRTQDKSLPIIVQGTLGKRKRERLDPIVFEDYVSDSSDSEQMEVSDMKRSRSQLRDEENTRERDATAEEQKMSQKRRGRPRRIIIDSTKQASYSFSFQDEKNFGFAAYDLVWGMSRRPLWWPGQIFEASLASKMTLDSPKDGQLLVAYFGDNTLEWCDKSKLMSFQSNFPQMAKQKGMNTFETAIGAALEDVSKRVQFSMICSCYRSGAYASRLNQKLKNSGITEGACGSAANKSWIINTFDPIKFIEYLHSLAVSSSEGANRLDLAIVNAQLDAFHHSKGHLERPVLMGEELVNKDKGFGPRKRKFDNDSTSNSHLSSKKHKIAYLDEKPLDISSELATITTGTAQDSYWNDIIISDTEEERTSEVQQGKGEFETRTKERRKIVEEPVSVSDCNLSSPVAIQLEPGRPLISLPEAEECMPTELFLTFGDSFCLPSIADLVQIFGRYGPLREAETNVIESLKFAKVVFKKRSDAETAEADLRGPGEYSLFGQACTGYRLDPAGPMESNPGPVQRLEQKRPLIKLQDGEECIPTELVLTFGDSYTLLSVADLVKICGQYGPLREVETEVVENLKIARVVFKRHTDAEIARSVLIGAGKYSFFRQAPVVGCKLKNLESTLQNFSLQGQPSK